MGFLRCKIDLTKIDKDKHLFKSEKGAIYLEFAVAERKEKGQYGDTHAIFIKKSKEDTKLYIGSAEWIEGPAYEGAKSQPIADDEVPW